MLFDPSVSDVRRFFCEAWRRDQAGEPVEPIQALAIDWMREHPEYHAELADPERAQAAAYSPESGRSNPFLHLSMHLALAEQVAADQPSGIRRCMRALTDRTGSVHDAAHVAMECLAETLWEAQRAAAPIDPQRYRERLHRKAGLPVPDASGPASSGSNPNDGPR